MRNLSAPLLIFGYGNPSRGDDAIGPALLDRLAALNLPHVELLTDFQLQVEHAMDLQNRERVLFIDASISCAPPYSLSRLHAQKDKSYTSHAVNPAAVLHAYQELYGAPPATYLLAVRGERFELGEDISEAAAGNMEASFELLRKLCLDSGGEMWGQAG
ncbi:MAG: hydrogenase maturation protease [Gammaproteobacteria bacterium]|nr:hydrogenase maturation protease [Gammaproteobacteria bacterium]